MIIKKRKQKRSKKVRMKDGELKIGPHEVFRYEDLGVPLVHPPGSAPA